MKVFLAVVATGAILMLDPSKVNAHAADTHLSEARVIKLQTDVFTALQHDDRAAWERITVPDFRAFERGKQYGRASFFNLVLGMHQAGVQAVWSVTEAHVQVDHGIAVMSYVNAGSVAKGDAAPAAKHWLETVAFRRHGEDWKAFLLTSMVEEDSSNAAKPSSSGHP